MSRSPFKDDLISMKIIKKSRPNKKILEIRSICRFDSVSLMKLLSIKVKKVINPSNNVTKKTKIIKIFFLIKSIINIKSQLITYKLNYE